MPYSFVRNVILVAVLSVALAIPARAETTTAAGNQVVIGIVAAGVGVAVLVTVLVLRHGSKKKGITGCVRSGASGLTVTDETDRRDYALSGDTAGVKAGDRMKLLGKKSGTTFEARGAAKDLGACTP